MKSLEEFFNSRHFENTIKKFCFKKLEIRHSESQFLKVHDIGMSNFIKFSLLFLIFQGLIGCKQEVETPITATNQLSKNTSEFQWADLVTDCSNFSNCTNINCLCPGIGCCSRQNLDPCNYPNMGAYAIAVATELCKATTNCTGPSLSTNCSVIETKCLDFSLLPYGTFSEDPDGNPFHFCSNTTSCSTYYCPEFQANTPYLHIPVSIALQNQIAAQVNFLASLFMPACPSNICTNCTPSVSISYSVCNDGSSCENISEEHCWNTKIIVQFTYICCGGSHI
ncbi:MAG: hypothetical protein IPQ10_04055 [Saprospiraceae bacterium]|nr:hypothetical protein [Saprospiraceae bacterium]MBL0260243.1 hypothetical protein [Saprospiraceae bacterium]